MAWKSIRLIAKIVGHDCRSPRGCLKLAYSMGWIDDEEKWLKLLEARNQTSHTYNLYIALDVYITVKENSQVFHNLLKKLKTEI
jgi:nucleotidyltransferase substrate binding protein (TIGR01987 family)